MSAKTDAGARLGDHLSVRVGTVHRLLRVTGVTEFTVTAADRDIVAHISPAIARTAVVDDMDMYEEDIWDAKD